MSGETEAHESGWTVDTLKYFMDQQFIAVREVIAALNTLLDERADAQNTAVQAALQSAKEAVTKAEAAAEKRFEATNEFRGQLADQQATLLSRTEYGANHNNLVERVNELTDRINRSEGKGQGFSAGWGYLVSGVTTVTSLIIAILVVVTR